MKSLRPILRNVVTASALACVCLGAYAEKVRLKADLKASSEVPPTDGKGHGMLRGTVDTDTNVFTYHVTFADLTGPAMAAHFHGPAAPGESAKPQLPVKTSPLVSPINGTATLTPDQVQDLVAGKWYFNIHTAKNPGGEIRGQVEK